MIDVRGTSPLWAVPTLDSRVTGSKAISSLPHNICLSSCLVSLMLDPNE